MKLDYTRNRQ